MEIINFSEQNSIINQYMAEIRDKSYQKNRLLFRNNVMRIGEFEAFEISKRLQYVTKEIETPLGKSKVNVPVDKIVLATIFRAGLPFHNGFLNIFDHAGNAFVSAYREYKDEEHHEVGIHVEYLATPNIDGKTLIIADPMLATGGSMELGYKAILTKGTPRHVHVACVCAAPEGIDHIRKPSPIAPPPFGVRPSTKDWMSTSTSFPALAMPAISATERKSKSPDWLHTTHGVCIQRPIYLYAWSFLQS